MFSKVASSSPQCQPRSIDPLKLKSKARLRYETNEEVCGRHAKAVAYDLNTSDPQFTRYLGDKYPDDLPAHKVPLLTRSVGPGYMEWLARECGGTYHHGEQAPAVQGSITVRVGLLARDAGISVQQVLQDMEDGDWSPEERQADLPGLRKLLGDVEALIQIAEGGAR